MEFQRLSGKPGAPRFVADSHLDPLCGDGDGGFSSGNGAWGKHTPLATPSSIHYSSRRYDSFGRQQRVYFRVLECTFSLSGLRTYMGSSFVFEQQIGHNFNP